MLVFVLIINQCLIETLIKMLIKTKINKENVIKINVT